MVERDAVRTVINYRETSETKERLVMNHRRAWEREYVLPYVSDELLPEDASAGDGTLKTVADVECAYEDGEEMYWFREKESEELNANFPFRIGDEGAAAD